MAVEDTEAVGIAGMAAIGNPRQPMDRSALAGLVNASANYTSHMTMHPRFVQPANDPAFFPTSRRIPVYQTAENGGARYGIQVPIPIPTLPEAGPTQANGRLVGKSGTSASFAGGAAIY